MVNYYKLFILICIICGCKIQRGTRTLWFIFISRELGVKILFNKEYENTQLIKEVPYNLEIEHNLLKLQNN